VELVQDLLIVDGGWEGVEVLGYDAVVGVEGAGLLEQGVGACGVAEETGLLGVLNELGDAVLAGDEQGEGVVAIAGVEGYGALEVLLGGEEVLAMNFFRAVEISVVGFAGLFGGDLLAGKSGGSIGCTRGRCRKNAGGNAGGGIGGVLCEGGGRHGCKQDEAQHGGAGPIGRPLRCARREEAEHNLQV
jgi:hypothetical protein